MIQGRRVIIALALMLGALAMGQSVWAQEVKVSLKNGDVLKGTLVSEGDVVAIKHSVLGDIKIPKASVKQVERIAKPEKQGASPANDKGAASGKGTASGKAVVAGKATASGAAEPKKRFLSFKGWSKEFEFGMNTQKGRKNRQDYSFRYDMRQRVEKNDYRLLAQKFYGRSEGEKTSDRALSSFRWRRDISPGVFYQTDTLYSSDALKEIDLSVEQKFGLGYRFINEKNFKLSTGLGLSSRYRDDSRGNNTTYLTDLFQDIDYRFSKRFRITQESSIALPSDDSKKYEIKFQAGMVSKISESLHMSIRYQLDYDRSQREDRREDQRIVSSIGLDF